MIKALAWIGLFGMALGTCVLAAVYPEHSWQIGWVGGTTFQFVGSHLLSNRAR